MDVRCVPVGPLQANAYLVDDGAGTACCVDPGGEPERLGRLVADGKLDLTHILLTHGHFDHVAGAAGLAAGTGAKVACSEYVRPMVEDPNAHALFPGFGDIPGYEPDLLLADGAELTVGRLTVRVLATPGHGPGDLTFDIGGALFCGDLLFRRSVGRTDFPGGSFEELAASVRRLLASYPPDTVVYPGHMEATTLGEEATYNPFLQGRI